MQQASCLEGGPLLWIWPLYLHVNQKSDDDDDDDDDDFFKQIIFLKSIVLHILSGIFSFILIL